MNPLIITIGGALFWIALATLSLIVTQRLTQTAVRNLWLTEPYVKGFLHIPTYACITFYLLAVIFPVLGIESLIASHWGALYRVYLDVRTLAFVLNFIALLPILGVPLALRIFTQRTRIFGRGTKAQKQNNPREESQPHLKGQKKSPATKDKATTHA